MGVTIHYKMGQKEDEVKDTLDAAERTAISIAQKQAKKTGIDMTVSRESDNELNVQLPGCETLSFDFRKFDNWAESDERMDRMTAQFLEDTIDENGWNYDLAYTSSFCKTQFADELICHKWVADIIKVVAENSVCSDVMDEGEYYHTGDLGDAENRIVRNGKLIDSLSQMVASTDEDVEVEKNETQIESSPLSDNDKT